MQTIALISIFGALEPLREIQKEKPDPRNELKDPVSLYPIGNLEIHEIAPQIHKRLLLTNHLIVTGQK